MASNNITWHHNHIAREDRIELFGHPNKVIWFTGLSGSGKSTIAVELENLLHQKGLPTYILDGDNIRHGLNHGLGFSDGERKENLRRIREVTKLFYDAGITVLVCFISPFEEDRILAREIIGKDFVEVFVDCDLSVCEKRDPKGLYKLARQGKIANFTGIDADFEKPLKPEIVLKTHELSVDQAVNKILTHLGMTTSS